MSKRRRKRHKPEQIVKLLREAEAMASKTVPQICHQREISESTYHRWRTQDGEMSPAQARQHDELKRENAELKKLTPSSARASTSCRASTRASATGAPRRCCGARGAWSTASAWRG